jgi:hypothetical protein
LEGTVDRGCLRLLGLAIAGLAVVTAALILALT